MTRSQLLLTIVSIVMISACVAPGMETPTTPPGDIQVDSVGFIGELEHNRTHFVMRGQLIGCWTHAMGPANCSDVTIELYAKNGTHLRTFRVGYLNGSKNISFVAPVVPYYVLIRSPDFWGHSFNEIDYYERGSDGRYWVRVVIERDEFPDAINVTNAD